MGLTERPGLPGKYVRALLRALIYIHLLRAFVLEPTRKTVFFSNSPLSLLRRARCLLRASSPVCLLQLSCTSWQREKNGSSASPIQGSCSLSPQLTKHFPKTAFLKILMVLDLESSPATMAGGASIFVSLSYLDFELTTLARHSFLLLN